MKQALSCGITNVMIARRTLLGFLGTLPLIQVARGQVAHRLTIIHLNDFHSRHEPVDTATLGCTAGATCFGGSPRLATAIIRQRQAAEADGRAVLLLDGGDQFQGSLFYTALHGDVELAVMHAVGTEAMAVGNHEFDNGPANLARFVHAANFPVLSANIEAGGPLAGLLRPYALFDRGGLRIAVIGLTTEETRTSSSPGPDVRFLPPGPAAAGAAKKARAEGAALVMVLSHLGLGPDHALAGTVPDIGVIVGGHSHSLLSNVEAGAVGPFPSVVGKTLIVQAGAYGRYLGRLDLDVAADGTVLAWGGESRHVGLDLPPDPAVAAIVAGFAAPLDAVRSKVVGHAGTAVGNTGCRLGECPLGDMVAEALLAADHAADVAIMNAGGIRTGLPSGDITLGDVIGVLPFGNTLATLKLKGSDLRAALLHGLSLVGRGGFPQVAGMRIGWNPLAPDQSSITVRQVDGRYLPLDPDRVYGVATNNFLRGGGDGYIMLRDAAIDPYDTGPGLEGLVADRIETLSPLQLAADGRLALP
jgi:5'-nucleotidase/UDP-sugar diphosphatase